MSAPAGDSTAAVQSIHDSRRLVVKIGSALLADEARDGRHAAAGRLQSARQAADADRLARHAFGDARLAEDDGHVARPAAHVGGRNIDPLFEIEPLLRHPFTKERRLEEMRQRRRVDGDAALAAAEGQFHQRRFPGHQFRKMGRVFEGDVRGHADPALGGAA